MKTADIPEQILSNVRQGTVIPAMPLALNEERQFQPRYQRALARYYIDAGAGGIAVGVHSTQFEIRDPDVGLFETVLQTTSEAIDEWCGGEANILKVAGICGRTEQAVGEAQFALANGYHAGLLSLSAFKDDSENAMLKHCRAVAEVMPIIGFYLQPSVGGRILPYSFWREFVTIDNVLAIKMAPFNRYQTLDVVRAVADAGREEQVTLYTGNDDNIIIDLLTPYHIKSLTGEKIVRIKGGLLGHWCVWTSKAVELLGEIHQAVASGAPLAPTWLSRNVAVTDCNAAIFDPAHDFAGCIPGIHEILRRQGLLPGIWCLNPKEMLSPGQFEEIDRVYRSYPELNDDDFIAANLAKWLGD